MKKVKILSGNEAACLVNDNDTIATSGFVQFANAETLTKSLEKRFLETGSPKDLTLIFSASQGNGSGDGRGAEHLAHKGMLKRVIASHYKTAARLAKMAYNGDFEAYNIPQGIILNMFRDIASHKIGTITSVGMGTFADPRNGGGKLNSRTTEDISKIVSIDGIEQVFYPSFPINVAFIRATYADEYGNITVENEVTPLECTSMAQAVKNSGGKVIVQVEKVVKGGTLDPKLVKIPGIYVEAVVVAEPGDHGQCFDCEFNPALSGQLRVPTENEATVKLDMKKIMGRRGALEIKKDMIVNLGVGVPEYIAAVAAEEGVSDEMTLTVEAGPIGGIPQKQNLFGASINPECVLDMPYQFDFYDGGGLDVTFLGLAECDSEGNINVSKFGPNIIGCGGFINISESSKKAVFCGSFTAGGLKTKVESGNLVIVQEGKSCKFVKAVDEITFSGKRSAKKGQKVVYITERAVFELRSDGVYLTEVAPGIDIQTQIFDLMEFIPKIDGDFKLMDARIFKEEKMGLKF